MLRNIDYHCNNCATDFTGNDLTTECPNCNSGNIEAKRKVVFSKSLLIGVLAVAVVVLVGGIVYLLLDEGESRDDEIIEAVTSNYEVSINKNSKQRFAVQVSKSVGGTYQPVDDIEIVEVKHKNGNEIEVTNKGELLLCYSDTGRSIPLKVLFTDDGTSYESELIADKLSLFGKAEEGSKCKRLLDLEEINIEKDEKSCTYKLRISSTAGVGKDELSISLNGESGTFKKYKPWKREDMRGNTYNVHFKIDENIVPYHNNGTPIPELTDCGKKEDVLKQLAELKRLANSYGQSPGDQNKQTKFTSYLNKYFKGRYVLQVKGQSFTNYIDFTEHIANEVQNAAFAGKAAPSYVVSKDPYKQNDRYIINFSEK